MTEIVFVDDGSTDETPHIAARYPVTVLTGKGQGPGAARNLGWRATECELIWFIDSDCVAEPDALEKLLPHLNDPEVAGVGGSYANLYPESLVASLIHEEIVARHRRMRREVNFLATFNVIYRRSVLSALSGYNEELKLVAGKDGALKAADPRQLQRMRSRLSMVFQHFNLWSHMTALENIIRKLQPSGVSNGPQGYRWIYKAPSFNDEEHDLIESIQSSGESE